MNQDAKELWGRIQAFPLDEPGSDFTFTQRLARENGWDEDYARRVADHYKKFMFLSVAAGHPVIGIDTLLDGVT